MRTLLLNISPPKRLLNSTLRVLSDRYPVSNLKTFKVVGVTVCAHRNKVSDDAISVSR